VENGYLLFSELNPDPQCTFRQRLAFYLVYYSLFRVGHIKEPCRSGGVMHYYFYNQHTGYARVSGLHIHTVENGYLLFSELNPDPQCTFRQR
jgi:hypothetical protein